MTIDISIFCSDTTSVVCTDILVCTATYPGDMMNECSTIQYKYCTLPCISGRDDVFIRAILHWLALVFVVLKAKDDYQKGLVDNYII